MLYDTYEQAAQALEIAEQDVIADHGEEALEQAYSDIVRGAIVPLCTPEIAAELIRRKL